MDDTYLKIAEGFEKVAQSFRALASSKEVVQSGQVEELSDQKADTPAEPPKPTVTIEQIRSVLAKKSQAGKTADVRELLGKFGATKLSEINQDSYPELLKSAEEL